MLCAELPAEMRRHPSLFAMIHPAEQVELHWTGLLQGLESAWEAMSWRGRVLSVYRSVQEGVRLPAVEARTGEDSLVECALIALRSRQQPGLRRMAQGEIDRLFKEHVARLAEQSAEPLDLYPLLPLCAPEQVKLLHCEGRAFRPEGTSERGDKWAFCPRARNCCAKRRADEAPGFGLYGARVEALPALPWREWCLTELLQATGTLGQIERSREPGEYASGLAGWVNRLNEIRRRLKCTVCQSTMRPQPEYARYNEAAYNRTVASCPTECVGNVGIYLSHCWACRSVIDSRNNGIRVEGFLLCLGCGSGPLSSSGFAQGDICPRCGRGPMERSHAGRDRLRCRFPQCTCEIKLPPEHRRTGPNSQRTGVRWRQGVG